MLDSHSIQLSEFQMQYFQELVTSQHLDSIHDAIQLLIESHDSFAFRLAQMDRLLAAVPKWTYITDDPATWPPPQNTLMAKHCGGACWNYWVVLNPSQIDRQSWGKYWRVIPPPVTQIYKESEI